MLTQSPDRSSILHTTPQILTQQEEDLTSPHGTLHSAIVVHISSGKTTSSSIWATFECASGVYFFSEDEKGMEC